MKLKSILLKNSDLFILRGECCGSWWSDDARGQVINSDIVDLVLSGYFELSTKMVAQWHVNILIKAEHWHFF